MDLLIDSHVLIWTILDDPRLKPSVRSALADGNNRVYASLASLWEAVVEPQVERLNCLVKLVYRVRPFYFL